MTSTRRDINTIVIYSYWILLCCAIIYYWKKILTSRLSRLILFNFRTVCQYLFKDDIIQNSILQLLQYSIA